MELIRELKSPCEQVCTHALPPPAHNAAQRHRTLLTVSSSSCCDAHDDDCDAATALWLSVALTAELDVVVQTTPNSDRTTNDRGTTFAAQLAACHGVAVKKSCPQFARLSCTNLRELADAYQDLLTLPLAAERVVARDVSTRSAVGAPSAGQHTRSRDRSNSPSKAQQARATVGVASWCTGWTAPVAAQQTGPPNPTQVMAADAEDAHPGSSSLPENAGRDVNDTRLVSATTSVDEAAAVAHGLPTMALLLTAPLFAKRALLLLRPTVQGTAHARHRHKCSLAYVASLWPVSESVQRVALSPGGDAVFALCDRLEHLSPQNQSTAKTGSGEEHERQHHLVLRGSYAELPVRGQGSTPLLLRPLLLHMGLCGSSASQRRAVRSVLRSVVSSVWCRCGLRQSQQQPIMSPGRSCNDVLTAVTELTMYTTEGHVLVFQPVLEIGSQKGGEAESGGGDAETNVAVHEAATAPFVSTAAVYTCCYGTRLPYSQLSGSATASACGRSGASLLIAPPWRFMDQWCHSLWFRHALEGGRDGDYGDGAAEPSRPRRHPRSTVLATSANRRVWLVSASARLSLVTVPSTQDDADEKGTAWKSCSAAVVKVSGDYTLHDAQFVQSGCHGGFLLLCRRRRRGSGGGGDDVAADNDGGVVLAASPDQTAMHARYIYGACSSPMQVFFLSLLAMSAPDDGDGRMTSSLLSLPLHCSTSLRTRVASLCHPSHRLRFVCAAAVALSEADVCSGSSNNLLGCVDPCVYIAVASSGSSRTLWAAAIHLPPLSTWCNGHLLRVLSMSSCGGRGAASSGSALPLPARVQEWVTHAVSAALPFTELQQDTKLLDARAGPFHEDTSLSSSSISDALQVEVEGAILHLHHQYHDSGRTPRWARAVRSVEDVLYYTLKAFTGVFSVWGSDAGSEDDAAGEAVASVTGVFAGFCAALRMSGVLGRSDRTSSSDSTGGPAQIGAAATAGLSATRVTLALLYRCAQVLLRALEGLCLVGHVSALLACASHLARSVDLLLCCGSGAKSGGQAGASTRIATPPRCTTNVVWKLVLQPLFDLVWGVVRDYGLAAEVTGDVLLYCSPAVRAMARSGPMWCPGGGTKRPLAITPAGVSGGDAQQDLANGKESGPTATDTPHSLSSPRAVQRPFLSAAPATPAASSVPATAHTSAELYDVVRRVFLLQGAEAALRLVHELCQHESTRDGVTEMAQLYEAMQQRLDQITA